MNIKKDGWKIVGILLLFYSFYFGFLGDVPKRDILNETIRNLYFHVPLWFAMIFMLLVSVVHSIKYLKNGHSDDDTRAMALVHVSMVFGLLGCITGATWANFTWGQPWPNDPKLNGVAIGMLIYAAYVVLRMSVEDPQRRATLSGVYNIFAYVIFMVLVGILPRLTDSLHPGNGGNPAFGQYDLDNNMRMVFYPAVIGFIILGLWMGQLYFRTKKLEQIIEE